MSTTTTFWWYTTPAQGSGSEVSSATPAVVGAIRPPVSVKWVGCYDWLGSDEDIQGAPLRANATMACAWACEGFDHMMLHNGGWCTCRDVLPEASRFTLQEVNLCAPVCNSEAGMLPPRFCGGPATFAVYSLNHHAGAAV